MRIATRYPLLTELYQDAIMRVVQNSQAWQNFLTAVCRNYKCRFDEQILIYAQHPDTTAIATMDMWNQRFHRWVNKGSKSIAVFHPNGQKGSLKYYFDVADTHDGYYRQRRPVFVWRMKEEYKPFVIEQLSQQYDTVDKKDEMTSAFMKIAEESVDENLPYYLTQLKGNCKDSFLEELDDLNLSVIYKRFVSNSVGYLLCSRCGLDTEIYFEDDDFSDIFHFNTVETVNPIGFVINNMAKPILKEISAEVNQAQNFHLFAVEKEPTKWYGINNIMPERNDNDDGQNNLHETGGLSDSRFGHAAGNRGITAGSLRTDAQRVSGTKSAGNLSQSIDNGQIE